MNIPDFREKLKSFLGNDEVYTILLVVLVGAASFGLGRASLESAVRDTAVQNAAHLAAPRTAEAREERSSGVVAPLADESASSTPGMYVASKSGTKYHLPWCGGAKQIKEENKVWFPSKEEAENAGYSPAANCKGI